MVVNNMKRGKVMQEPVQVSAPAPAEEPVAVKAPEPLKPVKVKKTPTKKNTVK